MKVQQAATMAGAKAGVAKKLLNEESRALYTHCYRHSFNLICGDTIRSSKLIKILLTLPMRLLSF